VPNKLKRAPENFVPGNCGSRSRVLVINPGSTSTKFGVFTRIGPEWLGADSHPDEELAKFRGMSALAQLEYRAAPLAAT
jgi:butyrate kinase